MIDADALWRKHWNAEVAKRRKESPSYKLEDYTVTGRAAAKYGGKRSAEWFQDNGPGMVRNWIEWRKRTRWEIWEAPDGKSGIELELKVTLPGHTLPVLMFLDRVFVLPTGELGVLDLKTGRTPDTPEQLGFYATGIELAYGPQYRPTWGWFWDANKGEHGTPLDLSMFTPSYFGSLYREAIQGINAGMFLAQVKNNCPAWCGVSQFCAAAGGSKAFLHDPVLRD